MRALCTAWLLAAAADAYLCVSSAPLASPALRGRAGAATRLRAAADKPAESARAALDSYAGTRTCRNFNRVSFERHFSRQGSTAGAQEEPSFMQRLAEVPLDLLDGPAADAPVMKNGVRGRADASGKGSMPNAQ